MKPIWKVEDARLALLKRLDGSALTAEDSGMKKRVNRSTLQTAATSRLLAHPLRHCPAQQGDDASEARAGRPREYCPVIDQTGTFRRFRSDPSFLPKIS
jgi:hypothetical protein